MYTCTLIAYKVTMKLNFLHVHEYICDHHNFFTWQPLSVYHDEYKIEQNIIQYG